MNNLKEFWVMRYITSEGYFIKSVIFMQFDPMMPAGEECKAWKKVFLDIPLTKETDITSSTVITKWDQTLRDNEVKLLLNSSN